ncbi:DUF4270 domain-containing protein [Chitinophaga nivalis]|uniref:DUF4270 domain-containing protein n=1 Tax=Chitinophaga nivalis TaxID=2991709 RepID=A0ABT3IFR2_9BACT|nr:DUF4270 domain-containing protein [Chitinophaga nivalis]MCW3467557.1 DUF4270 domain-containing protein [Chitinophaga nivalis]MCW3482751.1 DUF4270 domain-containing protein [Chitinophaga nivalis]
MNHTMCYLFSRHSCNRSGQFLWVLLWWVVFTACEKTGFNNENIVGSEKTDYILTDTLTLQVKTIQYDSIPTSGSGVLLAGKRIDPLFGKITASSFFQVAKPGTIDIPKTGSKYDSIRLLMRPTGYISGDSLPVQQYQVYRVISEIKFPKDSIYLYNKSKFPTESTPIGTFNGIVYPRSDRQISIPLTDVLGEQLFNMMRDKSPDITDAGKFLDFFKGLQVRGGANNKAVMAFMAGDTTLKIRLYYHTNEIITTVKYVDFQMQAANLQFNQVLAERSGTPLEAFSETVKELPSTSMKNIAYMQPITGVATRIDIPYLKNLPFLGKFFKIMKATLIVSPQSDTYTDFRLPPRLVLCQVDNKNRVTDSLSYGLLTLDDLYNLNTTYTYDITKYCVNQLTVLDFHSRGLLLTPGVSDSKGTLDRLAIGDHYNKRNKLTVQLYYLLYK